MKIINLIFRYFTDPDFRANINIMMDLASNRNGIADDVEKHMEEIKTRLKKRVSELDEVVTMIRPISGSNLIISKLNFLLNEMKDDLRSLD